MRLLPAPTSWKKKLKEAECLHPWEVEPPADSLRGHSELATWAAGPEEMYIISVYSLAK